MPTITPEQARSYLERWSLLDQFELAELRRTSMETKLRQLASLMQSRDLFAADPLREEEAVAVRRRWDGLREVLA